LVLEVQPTRQAHLLEEPLLLMVIIRFIHLLRLGHLQSQTYLSFFLHKSNILLSAAAVVARMLLVLVVAEAELERLEPLLGLLSRLKHIQ
jgi:hypothetical protein